VSGLPAELSERRLLVLAPVGKDAALVERTLRQAAIECAACRDLDHLLKELERGAAGILVAEEALPEHDRRLASVIARQPSWSDLPVLLLTRMGADSPMAARAPETLGNVTLLERPVRVAALTSAARSALRVRERQYQTRAYLAEREEADRRKDQFLATLAHELRNPLAPIRNTLAILRRTVGGEAAVPLYEIVERQLNQMVRLIDDLMEVSRITRGSIELRRRPVELADVIAAAVETSRPLIDSANHELTVSLPGETLLLYADAMRLSQVFSNLLNNAAKYTDPGGRIDVSARRESGQVVITVSDTGVGIPAEALATVFEMFVQADSRDERAQTGLGIGLTLVRSLVEMHNGSVSAASDGVGRGSRFSVRLPLAREVDERVAISSTATAAVPSPRLTQRILIVDDNRDSADTLGALLGLLGADVRVAYDGASALQTIENFHPTAIVLDLGMPGMDGYELARRIRERPDTSGSALIALTGWGQDSDRHLTRAAGFDHHLIKPVDFEHMQAVLASLTE
jgi:two-component system, sensor histidine kinase